MKISIIIIVKNDPEIELTLRSLVEIPKPVETEILVIDASLGKLDYIKNKFNSVRWITYPGEKNKNTIPQQRNVGISHSKGDIIIFIDANCIPDHRWLLNLYKEVEKGEKVVAGKTISSDAHVLNTISPALKDKTSYVDEAPTLNLLVQRDVFEKIGMFDENFSCAEDIDFCWKAKNAGYLIKYAPEAVVRHNYGSIVEWCRRAIRYGESRVYLYAKHEERLRLIVRNNIDVLIFPFLPVFLLASFKFPIFLFAFLIIILKNYNKHAFIRLLWYMAFGLGVWKGIILIVFNKKTRAKFLSPVKFGLLFHL